MKVLKLHEPRDSTPDDDNKIMDDDDKAGRVNLYNDNDSDSDDYQPQTGGWGVANSQASR